MKKVTKNTLKAYMNSFDTNTVIPIYYNDKQVELEIKNKLTLSEISSIVEEVVSACFVDSTFHPEYVDAVFFAVVVNRLTNIDAFTSDNETIDLETMTQLLYGTDVYNVLSKNGNIAVIRKYCDDAIEWKKQTILKHSKLDDLIDQFSELAKTFQDEEFQEAMKQLIESQK